MNSMLLFPLWATLTIIISCVVVLIVAIVLIVPINIWFRALASGAHVSMFRLIGMKMRKVDYKKLVNIYIISQKAGMLALFLEGCGVLGALFNLMFYELTGSMVFSLVIASLILGVMSGTVAWVTLKSKGNCMFSGLALNLVFTGLAGFLAKLFYGSHEIIYYYCDSELSVIIMILSFVFTLNALHKTAL